ncbi:alpha-L-rhamnosidase C-terminal domain-containing protein [Streptomyces sp. INA 01156]
MNSFNHYAYGSVGEWMYANIAGIARAGRATGRSSSARARAARSPPPGHLHLPLRPVSTAWEQRSGRFRLSCGVPANTTAEVWIPTDHPDRVAHTHGTFVRAENGFAVFEVGSGNHRFTV